jgi:hypothetical protein
MHENKKIFFLIFNVLTKTKYFNTRFVSLRYKTQIHIKRISVEKIRGKNHKFF